MGIEKLDQPAVLNCLFHPRKEMGYPVPDGVVTRSIAVDKRVSIGSRLYLAGPSDPHILFFHGNGEIAADYDDIGPVYNRFGLNLLAMDYRGYGSSEGEPSVDAMLNDAHVLFRAITEWMQKEERPGPLWVMGRSLGSVSALEIASVYPRDVSGLIVESGFAYTVPLLRFLGVDVDSAGIAETDCFRHVEKIENFSGPTLIIHAEYDQFIPVSDAETLLHHSAAVRKDLRVIQGADHNSIFMVAGDSYFTTVQNFIEM